MAAGRWESLPMAEARWEVALLDDAVQVKDVATDGLLLVVEEGSGHVRAASILERGKDLWPIVEQAAVAPPKPVRPARPRVLVCADRALSARLQREAPDGIVVALEDALPFADEAADAVAGFIRGPRAPGITSGFGTWAATLDRLCRLAPWESIGDDVQFRFRSEIPELAEAIAIILGNAGEQYGFVLYDSAESFERFLEMAEARDMKLLAKVRASCLEIAFASELDLDEQADVRARGLALPGERMPRVYQLASLGEMPLDERGQRVLQAALLAVLGLFEADPSANEAKVSTPLGTVDVVAAVFSTEPPPLLDMDYSAGLVSLASVERGKTRRSLALVLKARKPDARRIARLVQPIDRVRAERLDDGGGRRGHRASAARHRTTRLSACLVPNARYSVYTYYGDFIP